MQKYKVYINKQCEIVVDSWDEFCSRHLLIEAAGGLVYNSNRQILMIYRDGFWDLPKGKLEAVETIPECAIREVEEECGVSNLEIIRQLKSTYHTYEINGKSVLKHTYWFHMTTNYDGVLVPQISEGITKVEWVDKKNLMIRQETTYASIRGLLLDI